MSKLFTVLFVLGIVNVKSDKIPCQMVPIKTEKGLMGYCCMYSVGTSSESKKEELVQQILRSPNMIRRELGKPTERRPPPSENERLIFMDDEKDFQSPAGGWQPPERFPIPKPVGTQKTVTSTTVTSTTMSTTTKGDNSAETSTTDDSVTATTVELGNRNNLDAPKSCPGDSKKTSHGECETAFG